MKITSKQTDDFKREFSLGLDHQRKKNFNEAAACYKKAIQDAEDSFKFYKDVDPSYSWAYNNLGIVFTNLKKKQEAIDCFFKAIKIDPKFTTAYFNLGNVFKSMEKHQEAVDQFTKAIALDPRYHLAWAKRAEAYVRMGLTQKAEEDLRSLEGI